MAEIRIITDPEIITGIVCEFSQPSYLTLLHGQTKNFRKHLQSTETSPGAVAEFKILSLISYATIVLKKDDLSYANSKGQISLRDMASLSGSLSDYMFSSKEERPTIILGKSDTLIKIAETMFHDFKIAWLIAELNEDRTKQTRNNQKLIVEIELEEVIRLPFNTDIEDFYRKDRTRLEREQIKTVIKNNRIHKEIIEKELKPIVAPEISWPVSKIAFAKLKGEKDEKTFRSFTINSKASKVNLNTIIQNGIAVSRSIDD